MNSDLAVRIAVPSDLRPAVALLEAQLREHEIFTPAEALREVARQILSGNSDNFILLADFGGEHVGLAYAAAHLSAEHGGTVGWLEELYVQPEWRGRGAGSILLRELITRARQLRWRALELEVVEGHGRALPLYLRYGFQPNARQRLTRNLST